MGGATCRFVGDTVEDILEQVKGATLSALSIPLWPNTELVVIGPDFDPDNPKKDATKIFKLEIIGEDDVVVLGSFRDVGNTEVDVRFTEIEKGRIWHVSLLQHLGGLEPNKWNASISFRK